jgi:hypothetical protein
MPAGTVTVAAVLAAVSLLADSTVAALGFWMHPLVRQSADKRARGRIMDQ